MRRLALSVVASVVALVASLLTAPARAATTVNPASVTQWVYQLQGYQNGKLDQVATAKGQLAVVDLARDGVKDYFRATEIAAVRASGKKVLSYFEIGSIENFRPEYAKVKSASLRLNQIPDWPGEYYTRYWDQRWWDLVVRPRVDQSIRAGFDGVYLDTLLSYEELRLSLVKGETRDTLARKMVALVKRISVYGKQRKAGFLVVPQNAPELRRYSGYVAAIDGLGVEDLFYSDDEACTEDWCAENLANTQAVRAAGKFILAVDYAVKSQNVRAACAKYKKERFAGYVTVRDLDRLRPACP